MAVYLLDTNHASPLVTLHHPLRKRVLDAMNAGDQFAVCAPVETEVWYGDFLPITQLKQESWR